MRILGLDLDPGVIAYAAGLFEGEGSVSSTGRHISIRVQMTDREPLEFMLRWFGGRIRGPIYHRGGRKPQWCWTIQNWPGVQDFHDAIKSWLSPRRLGQFSRALSQKPVNYRGYRPFIRQPDGCATEVIPTMAFYERHRKRGEKCCDACLACLHAYREELRRRRAS